MLSASLDSLPQINPKTSPHQILTTSLYILQATHHQPSISVSISRSKRGGLATLAHSRERKREWNQQQASVKREKVPTKPVPNQQTPHASHLSDHLALYIPPISHPLNHSSQNKEKNKKKNNKRKKEFNGGKKEGCEAGGGPAASVPKMRLEQHQILLL